MTEDEAIEYLIELKENYFQLCSQDESDDINDSFDVAISCLQEIQKYRLIGSVEECRKAREKQNGDCPICGLEELKSIHIKYCPRCEQLIY